MWGGGGTGDWGHERDRNSLADALSGRRKAKPRDAARPDPPSQTLPPKPRVGRRASLVGMLAAIGKSRSVTSGMGRTQSMRPSSNSVREDSIREEVDGDQL